MPLAASTEHRYSPHGACREIFNRRDPEVLLSGPAGTGKSLACLEKVMFTCLLNPGVRILVVRKTHVSLQSSALVTWRTKVIAESLRVGHVKYYGGSVHEAGYYFGNGSVVVTGGLDKPTKVMSTEWDMIYVQEAIELTLTDWEALTTRLRNGMLSYQQLIADTNPAEPTHWLKRRADAGTVKMLESRHEDNPTLMLDGKLTPHGTDYMSKLDALSGVRLQRLRYGKWVAAEGIIYEDWDAAVHLVDRMPKGWESWARYWSVDFGFTNPFVWQCWAESPDGELYLYREIYRTKRTVEQHAIRMKQVLTDDKGRWTEPRPQKIICDHDAEGRAQLEKHFGSTTPAHKAVTEGIQACQERYKSRRLFIVRNCRIDRDEDLVDRHLPTCTEEEVSGYVWMDNGKEAPVKENDHGMDAERYLVAYRDLGKRGHGFRGYI